MQTQTHLDVARVVGSTEPITVWNAPTLSAKRRANHALFTPLSEAIDELGRRSKMAQGLSNVLTSTQKLLDFPEHRVYLYAVDKQFIGILKVGTKKLFIRTKRGELVELDLLCVLDFYVHESHQRHGIGRVLFDAMLEKERKEPVNFGYDRPSPKLLGFLRKHFGLADFVPQTNNFVVFDRYFEKGSSSSSPPSSRPSATSSASSTTAYPSASSSSSSTTKISSLQSSSNYNSYNNNNNNNNNNSSRLSHGSQIAKAVGQQQQQHHHQQQLHQQQQHQLQASKAKLLGATVPLEGPRMSQPPEPQKRPAVGPATAAMSYSPARRENSPPQPQPPLSSHMLSKLDGKNTASTQQNLSSLTTPAYQRLQALQQAREEKHNPHSHSQEEEEEEKEDQHQEQQKKSSSAYNYNVLASSNPVTIGVSSLNPSIYTAAIQGRVGPITSKSSNNNSSYNPNLGGSLNRRTASSGKYF